MNTNEKIVMILKKMPTLFFGLFLFAVSILATIYSNLGASPWDVFHIGVTKHFSLTLGQASELTGLVILGLSCFIGVIPGLASVFNMIFIGVFIDILNYFHVFSTPESLLGKIMLLIVGIILMGWASYFYLKVEMGAGPRDSLMEGLVKKLNKPVWMIRGTLEIMALILGFLMGGPVGIGTVIIALTLGFSVQFAFKAGKYSSKNVQHLDLIQMYRLLRKKEVMENSV